MHSSRRRWFVVLPLFLLLLGAAPPQNQRPEIPSMGETIEVSIINLDVVVTDRHGKRVRGLKVDDFEILENKTPQAISNFAEYSSFAGEGTVGVDAPQNVEAPPRQPRTVVLFVERMPLREHQARPVVQAIRELLDKTIEPGDAVSIVVWGRRGDLRIAFTDDRREIDKALANVVEETTRAMFDGVLAARELMAETKQFEAEVAAAAAARGETRPALNPATAGDATAEVHAMAAMSEMKRRVHAINATINSMAGRDGKKILLLATRRLGAYAGAEFFFANGQAVLDPIAKTRYATADLMKTIVDNANAAGVTIYPIYAPGLPESMPDASTRLTPDVALESRTLLNEMDSLTAIARETGGIAASNAVDIVKLLPKVEEDLSDYYSLAYRVTSSRTDRSRGITVRAKNAEYTVRARRQYVEKTDTTRMKDRLVAVLFRDSDESLFAIEAEIGTPRKQGRRTVLPVKVRVPIKELTVLPSRGKNAGAFSVFVASSIHEGRVSDVTQQTQSFEIAPADMARAMRGHFTYSLDVVVDDNVSRVAVGVYDEVGKTYGLLRLDVPGRGAKVAASR